MTWRTGTLVLVSLIVLVGVALQDRIPQDLSYFLFADRRTILGVPNFFDVLSNVPFFIVGLAGLRLVVAMPGATTVQTRTAWGVFFLGIFLTAFGSGYFHLWPENQTLIWDRLPMTIGFMSLMSIVIAEYFSQDLGRKLLTPLIVIGFLSVVWWAYTESIQQGDLRPYAIVQFLPMLLIPLIAALFRGKSDIGAYIPWLVGFYVAAKLAEFYDAQIFEITGFLSGHSIKHVLAAGAPAALLLALRRRAAPTTTV